jgi:hypothetical protein
MKLNTETKVVRMRDYPIVTGTIVGTSAVIGTIGSASQVL